MPDCAVDVVSTATTPTSVQERRSGVWRAGAGVRTSVRALVLGLVASLLVLAPVQPIEAAVVVPFGVAFQTNDNGAIALFGNNVLTCPVVPETPSRCLNAKNGTGPSNTQNDNNHVMVNVDADADADDAQLLGART